MTAPDHNTPKSADRHKVPYSTTRETLYSAKELYAGYDAADESTRDQCYDAKVYRHYISTGKHTGLWRNTPAGHTRASAFTTIRKRS